METNLPIKKKDRFIDKIKNFFKYFFRKNYDNTNDVIKNPIQEDIKLESREKNDFQDNIKVEVKDEYIKQIKKEEFLSEIERDPTLLYELPIEKIEKIEKYYDELIAEYQNKIYNFKKSAKNV